LSDLNNSLFLTGVDTSQRVSRSLAGISGKILGKVLVIRDWGGAVQYNEEKTDINISRILASRDSIRVPPYTT
jgi:hypothetical protein